ncbi:OLC1v1007960C1 [Oldenlandia corymbosa var. corymbosa]|uniref:OLC1v1007960C1 n=1 Tax=Oldenlandia corymbosa var. corymbosa TaxID=529605 RepID=A0AAV1DNV6_OLDCO|nr:OLC1v1007960C1 [Oldenlandia corymbosa var. corymbosa]
MADINANNFYHDDGPPILVDRRADLYADVAFDPSRMATPTTAEGPDSDSPNSQEGSFHSLHSLSIATSERSELLANDYINDAERLFHMPDSFYDIPNVSPSVAMLDVSDYVPDNVIPNVPDYPNAYVFPISVFHGIYSSVVESDNINAQHRRDCSRSITCAYRSSVPVFSTDKSVDSRIGATTVLKVGKRTFKKFSPQAKEETEEGQKVRDLQGTLSTASPTIDLCLADSDDSSDDSIHSRKRSSDHSQKGQGRLEKKRACSGANKAIQHDQDF